MGRIDSKESKTKDETWGNKWVYAIALMGSAIGLGNIWRFPYIAAERGITFIVFYIISAFFIGLPILYIESLAGVRYRKKIIDLSKHIFRKYVGNFGWMFGALSLIMTIIIISYYSVITGWTLFYLTHPMANASVNEIDANDLIYTAIVLIGAFVVLRLGINKGIGVISTVLGGVLFLSLIIMLFYSKPWMHVSQIMEKILSAGGNYGIVDTIIVAMSQAFFSLSAGMGFSYTYARYSKESFIKNGVISAAFADTFISIVALVVIVSFSLLLNVSGSGPALAFEILPSAFDAMPFSIAIKIAFFAALFSAAFTSLIALIKFIEANTGNAWNLVFALILILSLMVSYGKSGDLISLLDEGIIGHALPIVVFINIIMFSKAASRF